MRPNAGTCGRCGEWDDDLTQHMCEFEWRGRLEALEAFVKARAAEGDEAAAALIENLDAPQPPVNHNCQATHDRHVGELAVHFSCNLLALHAGAHYDRKRGQWDLP